MGNWNDPENDMSGLFEEDTGIKKYFEPKVDRQKPAAPWATKSPGPISRMISRQIRVPSAFFRLMQRNVPTAVRT